APPRAGLEGFHNRAVFASRTRHIIAEERIIADGLCLSQDDAVPARDQVAMPQADDLLVEFAVEAYGVEERVLALLLDEDHLLPKYFAEGLGKFHSRVAFAEPGLDGADFQQHPRIVDFHDIVDREAADDRTTAGRRFDQAVALEE